MTSTRNRILFVTLLALRVGAGSSATSPEDAAQPTVGMPARIEQLILPGTELEARPIEDRQGKVVLRVVDVFPHGTAFRYNLTYYGLEPGKYDLRDYLRRKDGSSTADLPPIPVQVFAILPPGQIEPHRLEPKPSAFGGGYKAWMIAAGLAWFVGFLAIVLIGRKDRRPQEALEPAGGPTLADRLRPLVEGAMAGTLGQGQHAELERMLIGYWRRRLGLEGAAPARAIAAIRSDERAGPLLHQLEEWLHRPDRTGEVDVARLLEPYRDLPAEALEGGPAPAGHAR